MSDCEHGFNDYNSSPRCAWCGEPDAVENLDVNGMHPVCAKEARDERLYEQRQEEYREEMRRDAFGDPDDV